MITINNPIHSLKRTVKDNHLKLFLVLLTAVLISACGNPATEEPPGVGEKAERGYALSEPVIAALEQYKADKGIYPESLTELVPDYISTVPKKDEALDFSYSVTDDGFAFSFHYIGPGTNTCTYKPGKEWRCSGAY
jgi:hypothetical protein